MSLDQSREHAAGSAQEPLPAPDQPEQPIRILLVEDEEAHLELLRRAFSARGERVQLVTAGSIAGARAIIGDATPDLAIVDLQLPDGRGTDLIIDPADTPSFPVVLMTSHGNEQVAVEAMKAGALDYVVKSPSALVEMPRVAQRALREWHHIIEHRRAEQERALLIERVRQQSMTVVRLATHPDLAAGRLESGLAVVAEAAAETLSVASVCIFRLSEDASELSCLAGYRQGTAMPADSSSCASLEVERYPRFIVALGRGPVLEISDARTDLRSAELTAVRWAPGGVTAALCAPVRLAGELVGLVLLDHVGPRRCWNPDEVTFAGQVADLVGRAFLTAELQQSHRDLRDAYDTTLEGWARALELRDRETEGHTRRVTEMTLSLATAMGMDEAELEHVRRGALLHDIGKMAVTDSLLLKPAEFTPEERRVMEQHPALAYEFLSPIAFLQPALDIPYCHHERWDGSGYPRGLVGEEIPLAARIFAVVDVWDALLSNRPYRSAWPRQRVISYLRDGAGSHFDPQVVQVFLAHITEAGTG